MKKTFVKIKNGCNISTLGGRMNLCVFYIQLPRRPNCQIKQSQAPPPPLNKYWSFSGEISLHTSLSCLRKKLNLSA